MENEFKTGFVGLVGPTNSGKSTLLNTLIGEKVSIVSRRAQTTYHGVRGILNMPDAQIIFVDTPGFQRHPEPVARLLNKVADLNAKDCELLVWIFDASNPTALNQCLSLKEKIAKFKGRENNLCLLNKIDKIPKSKLLPVISGIAEQGLFSDIIPICAQNGDGVDRLVSLLKQSLPVGPALFPNDMITDRSEQFLVSEMVREKIYESTNEEVPYSAWIEIEGWENPEGAKRLPTIRAVVHVDSASRKAILIGKGGEMLKRIGSSARQEIEKHLGSQIVLKLHVDVEQEWKRDSNHLNRYLELS